MSKPTYARVTTGEFPNTTSTFVRIPPSDADPALLTPMEQLLAATVAHVERTDAADPARRAAAERGRALTDEIVRGA